MADNTTVDTSNVSVTTTPVATSNVTTNTTVVTPPTFVQAVESAVSNAEADVSGEVSSVLASIETELTALKAKIESTVGGVPHDLYQDFVNLLDEGYEKLNELDSWIESVAKGSTSNVVTKGESFFTDVEEDVEKEYTGFTGWIASLFKKKS